MIDLDEITTVESPNETDETNAPNEPVEVELSSSFKPNTPSFPMKLPNKI